MAVRFECRDAVSIGDEGPFDLILVLEALHDMSRPREVLAALRGALTPGGSVLIADEKVADHFHAPGDDLERLMYGWSIVHCLPVSMAEQPSAAIGTEEIAMPATPAAVWAALKKSNRMRQAAE